MEKKERVPVHRDACGCSGAIGRQSPCRALCGNQFLVQPVLVIGNRLSGHLSPLSVVIETFDEFLRFENPLAAAVKVGFYLGNILGEHLLFLVFAAFSLPDDDIGDAVFLF